MYVNDPIADMLTRIRNATMAKHDKVLVPYSRTKEAVAKILHREGFVKSLKVVENEKKQKQLLMHLKYLVRGKESVIKGLKRVSKPGRRAYVDSTKVPKVLNGLGVAILSTSSGIMTDRACREKKVGGEVLCLVW